jgi:hypothetical protein
LLKQPDKLEATRAEEQAMDEFDEKILARHKCNPATRYARRLKETEWYYRTRFERSNESNLLLEYGRSPSAWRSTWFRGEVRKRILAFLSWCHNRRISLGKIAGWLNKNGPDPPRGRKWQKSTLKHLLGGTLGSDADVKIREVMRLLKELRRVERNQRPGIDQIIELSESAVECARRVWEMHSLFLPPFKKLSAYLVHWQRKHERRADRFQLKGTGMRRRGEFGFRFFGTDSLPTKTLRDVIRDAKSKSDDALPWVVELEDLEKAVPQFLDFRPTKFDMKLLGNHKTSEALLRILCRFEGISTRTARRYRHHSVQ